LSFIPGYEYIKSVASMSLGAKATLRQVLLVRIEDSLQLGFLVERTDGGRAVVFVPNAPNPSSGSIYFMTDDRFTTTDIPPAMAMKCLRRHGVGSAELLRGHVAGGGAKLALGGTEGKAET